MVAHKRLDYGFNGYQIPSFPRAPRSAKERSLFKKESDMCPIEMLASIAANLLQEGDSNRSRSNIADKRVEPFDLKYSLTLEQQAEEKLLEPSDESVIVSDCSLPGHSQHKDMKEPDVGLEHCSIVTDSSCLEKSDHAEIVTGERRNGFANPLSKIEVGSTGFGALCNNQVNVDEGLVGPEITKEINNIRDAIKSNVCSLECKMEWTVQPQRLISSGSSFEVPRSSFLPFQTNLKLVHKDNDENSSRCPLPSTRKMKAFRPPPRIVDRRIRRLLASRYWKRAPKLNKWEHSENDMLNVFRNKKACYNRRNCKKLNLFRRKLFQHRLKARSEEETHNEASPPSLVAAPQASCNSRDPHVKFSIKSFRVPELFIDIPETATVGSLKRTVREAVSAILSGGLCVGVVLQGMQVTDDSKTLLQTGISCDDKDDALGFMLEPHPAPASAPYPSAPAPAPAPIPVPVCEEDPSFLVSCDKPQPLARYSPTLARVPVPSDASSNTTPTNVFNVVEDILDAVPHHTDLTAVKTLVDSEGLLTDPNNFGALAAVPLPPRRRSRNSELAQRRIRRPFFVSEVEALVQAVEKLGTGRWRDVKGFAFDDAKHRTYVDLKDKWKTLVHTARISPQQRRGEPVPQELLDRVLAAHAYWSRHQVKQQTETGLTSSNPIEERAPDG